MVTVCRQVAGSYIQLLHTTDPEVNFQILKSANRGEGMASSFLSTRVCTKTCLLSLFLYYLPIIN